MSVLSDKIYRAIKYMNQGTPGMLIGLGIVDNIRIFSIGHTMITQHFIHEDAGVSIFCKDLMSEEEFFQFMLVFDTRLQYEEYVAMRELSCIIHERLSVRKFNESVL